MVGEECGDWDGGRRLHLFGNRSSKSYERLRPLAEPYERLSPFAEPHECLGPFRHRRWHAVWNLNADMGVKEAGRLDGAILFVGVQRS